MIAFIDAHREVYGVEPICRVLPIAPSTYHNQASRRAYPDRLPPRAKRDVGLAAEIRRVWEENFRVYGVRKVWRQLRREGIEIARCTTARLMKQMGLCGAIRGKTVKTTVSNKVAPCLRDKVNRQSMRLDECALAIRFHLCRDLISCPYKRRDFVTQRLNEFGGDAGPVAGR